MHVCISVLAYRQGEHFCKFTPVCMCVCVCGGCLSPRSNRANGLFTSSQVSGGIYSPRVGQDGDVEGGSTGSGGTILLCVLSLLLGLVLCCYILLLLFSVLSPPWLCFLWFTLIVLSILKYANIKKCITHCPRIQSPKIRPEERSTVLSSCERLGKGDAPCSLNHSCAG